MIRAALFIAVAFSLTVVTGCGAVKNATKMGTSLAVASGAISDKQAKSIKRGTEAAAKAFEKFTPENEYYIGRTVAANITSHTNVYKNESMTRYINYIGQSLACASDKPETFAGYHFLILDVNDINAFATPGGFILVTRGLLRCCRNEDQVAAVLAHEIAHVQLEHGIDAIKSSRYTALGKVVGVEIAKNLGDEQLAQAAEVFDNTVGDIMKTMVDRGYQRGQEFDADKEAVTILARVGYRPHALYDMLSEINKRMSGQTKGFAKTHPSPADRMEKVQKVLKKHKSHPIPASRNDRFAKALAGV